MNIFVLDRDPVLAAKYHCNKHVVKMILESAQMMCSTHWVSFLAQQHLDLKSFKRVRDAQAWLYDNMPEDQQPPWKMSHVNHPCSVWTRVSLENYQWHSRLGLALCEEYTQRYNKVHKAEAVHRWLQQNLPSIPKQGLQPHAVCMPEECKIPNDVVASYQKYYNQRKSHFAVWEPRAITPAWFSQKAWCS